MTQRDRPGELDDISAHTRLLVLAAQAMAGLHSITQPSLAVADEGLSGTRRSELAAVFGFFGETMRESAIAVEEALDRLETRLGEMQKTAFYRGLTERVAKEMAAADEHP